MRSGKIITLNVWLMIIFNLLLSFGAVWSFQRMEPEIKRIYDGNVKSLSLCEEMLLAMTGESVDEVRFRTALDAAGKNITEPGEKESIDRIKQQFKQVVAGDKNSRRDLTLEIINLTNFNKKAIADAALEAQKFRQAGAWGIVFMTLIFFVAAIFFEQKMRRSLLYPLQEIASVLDDNIQGNKFRRCNTLRFPDDIKKMCSSINELLDRNSF